ncbi:hypothetical protein E2320_012997, partial [Naja naja]
TDVADDTLTGLYLECQSGVCFHTGGEGCILAAAGSLIGVVPNDGQFPDAVGNRTNFLCTGP